MSVNEDEVRPGFYKIPLSQEERNEWADALESGKFEQGKEWLQSRGKFCCLGVLAEIKGLEKTKSGMIFSEDLGIVSYEGNNGLLDKKHMDRDVQRAFAYLNDSGYTFQQIAVYIRDGWVPTNGEF